MYVSVGLSPTPSQPVYIKHQVDGEPGPRYALLYDIDIDIESPIDPSTPMRTVTLSIEREFGWRGVAPGDNPKRWTYYVQKRPYTSASAALTSGGDHLATATIQNRREWNAGQTALGTQNYFDIPAASIPGDLDALCLLATTLTSGTSSQLYIARESKPDLSPGGTTRKPAYTLNAGDATLTGSDTTTGADTGAPISTNAAVNTRGAVSFATVATDTNRFTWHGGARGLFDMSSLRGRFMAFVRARLSASSTVTMHLSYGSSFATLVTPTATFTDATALGTGNTTEWSWVYLGLLTLPYSGERVQIKDDGLGINVNTGTTPYITLFAARTGGATNLYVSDVVFIPIDEAALLIDCGNTNSNTNYMIDNTGYLLHGQTDSAVHVGTIGLSESVEVRGQSLTLKPGVLNRILFMATNQTSSKSSINKDFAVRVNIVPRWSGYRDA